jgi:Mn2+/Fe2+ NRAMP family transporter
LPIASVESTYTDLVTSVFTTPIAFKAWFATVAAAFGIVQVATGARIFGKLTGIIPVPPPRVNRIHRWSGRLAVLFTLPVAFHCIFILGFQTDDARVFVHSVLGSFIYGVLAVKLFFVHDRDHPRWVLPVVGGTLFTILALLWSTSSLWYFTEVRFGF